ncbi:MAG: formate-dependent phosphoribosylglycinamide formyltransferase [Oligoflexia bacterium]|nr:formate-dependent phosphoribosylglycinamide formyltransferase [Oligoflexia bacterium]
MKKIMLLGSGELGKEFVISAKRLGLTVVAVDKYKDAPAMQVSDAYYIVNMLDKKSLDKVIAKEKPDIIVPEIEAIRTEALLYWEKKGIQISPCAKAVDLTMNRDKIRDFAAKKVKVRTANYLYANSYEEFVINAKRIGFPNVVKPVMSSSGKGQSIVRKSSDLKAAWKFAVTGMRGDKEKVIIEEFIQFESEITLLTIRQKNKKTLFVEPIGHRQEKGDYRESWIPAKIAKPHLAKAKLMAKKITDALGGYGIFGVEFFLTKNEVIFSELSPRPHDTGMVTLISQDLNEFDLHLRAILGIPIRPIKYYGPSSSVAILGTKKGKVKSISGLQNALSIQETDVRVFGKKETWPNRRMAVALARGKNTETAVKIAKNAAQKIKIRI